MAVRRLGKTNGPYRPECQVNWTRPARRRERVNRQLRPACLNSTARRADKHLSLTSHTVELPPHSITPWSGECGEYPGTPEPFYEFSLSALPFFIAGRSVS
jgi:hypothetical protein